MEPELVLVKSLDELTPGTRILIKPCPITSMQDPSMSRLECGAGHRSFVLSAPRLWRNMRNADGACHDVVAAEIDGYHFRGKGVKPTVISSSTIVKRCVFRYVDLTPSAIKAAQEVFKPVSVGRR